MNIYNSRKWHSQNKGTLLLTAQLMTSDTFVFHDFHSNQASINIQLSPFLQNLKVPQPFKQLPTFSANHRFISVFTTACLASPLSIQPFHYYPLFHTHVFQVVSFLHVSLPKLCMFFSFPPTNTTCSSKIIFGEEQKWRTTNKTQNLKCLLKKQTLSANFCNRGKKNTYYDLCFLQ